MHINVLIVEDHQVLAEALSQALQAKGMGVRTASSVSEALNSAKRHCPDVVLMDFRLPDGDGTAAASEIRSVCPEVKVLMLTAEAHEAVVLAAIEAGCSGYLLKNVKLEEVVDAVQAAHAGEMLISPSTLARVLPMLRGGRHRARSQLTGRETEVLALLAQGRSNQSIANELVLSPHTVRNHVQNIIQKLGAHSKLEAVAIAARTGLLRLTGE